METEGDGVNNFRNTVQSEVKGARSAGKFVLELCIEDDAGGEAVCATWKYSRCEDKPSNAKKAMAALDETVFEFVRSLAMRGQFMSRRKLRDHDEAPFGDKPMRASLDRMIDAGRLHLDGVAVRIPRTPDRDDQ